MYTAVLVLHIIVSVLMIAAVLLQSGKGSSMANVFGGGGMETSTRLRPSLPSCSSPHAFC